MAKPTNHSKADLSERYDNLTAIKGIKEARQQWFRDTMNVRTYDDFAALSVDQIESGLKAEKQFPSRSMIAAWIAQAKALAESDTHDERIIDHGPTREIPHWQPLASFVIEFQILENSDKPPQYRMTAHHIETDKNQLWSGIEQHESMDWMLMEAGISAEAVALTKQPDTIAHPAMPAAPGLFSDKLQHVLTKVAQLTETHVPQPTRQAAIDPVPASPLKPNQPSAFSEKMQQVLTLTQQITSKVG